MLGRHGTFGDRAGRWPLALKFLFIITCAGNVIGISSALP